MSLDLHDRPSRQPVAKPAAATKTIIATVLLATGGAVALSSCGTTDPPAGAPPATVESGPATAPPAATDTPGEPGEPATGQPGVSTRTGAATAATGGAASPCPVTGAALQTALIASSSDIYARAGKPTTLIDPFCYRQFATAKTAPDGKSQPSTILYGFDSTSRGWRPLNLGSSDFCTGFVPADVAAHLPGCN